MITKHITLLTTLLIALTLSFVTATPYPYDFCGIDLDQSDIPPPKDLEHLEMVQVIIRHGARTPVGKTCLGVENGWNCPLTHSEKPNYNKDGYLYNKLWMDDRNFYPGDCGVGILTDLGYNQQLKNGQYLRQLYGGFLPDVIDKQTFDDQFFIRSTNYPRTFLSGESLLTGLYPADKRAGEFSIDIHTMDSVTENLLVNKHTCPKSEVYSELFENSAELKNHISMYAVPLQKQVASALNMSIDDVDILSQSDCWMSAKCNGYNVNSAITNQMINDAVANAVYYFGAGFQYPDRITTARTGLGSFVQEFSDRFMDTINRKDNKKFALYSAHDTTLMPFLIALDMWDGKWPAYASMMTAELYNNGTQTVRFTYNGKVLYLPNCLGIEYCPFSKFLELVKLVSPTRKDCQVNSLVKGTNLFSVF